MVCSLYERQKLQLTIASDIVAESVTPPTGGFWTGIDNITQQQVKQTYLISCRVSVNAPVASLTWLCFSQLYAFASPVA